MTQTTLIANGTVVAADGEFDGDDVIEGEKITAVGRVATPEGADVVDATGCFVLPGLIDNHTHLSMPFMGTMSSDDYNTGTQAAAAGGVTCLVDFAIQAHPDDLQSTLDEWRGRADGAAHVREPLDVAGRHRLLDPVEAVLLEPPDPLDRLSHSPRLIRVDPQQAVGADRLADRRHALLVVPRTAA